MAKFKTIDLKGSFGKETEIDSPLFKEDFFQQPIFDSIIAENASKRQGTHSTLTKAEVSGGGRKPWMQKHTGRARQGSTRNPQWVKGGVAFGPKPTRNYEVKLPRKVAKLALRSAISSQKENVILMTSPLNEFASHSTKNFVAFLNASKLSTSKILFVVDEINEKLFSSAQNIKNIQIKHWEKVSTRDILNAKTILMTKNSISNLERKVA